MLGNIAGELASITGPAIALTGLLTLYIIIMLFCKYKSVKAIRSAIKDLLDKIENEMK